METLGVYEASSKEDLKLVLIIITRGLSLTWLSLRDRYNWGAKKNEYENGNFKHLHCMTVLEGIVK